MPAHAITFKPLTKAQENTDSSSSSSLVTQCLHETMPIIEKIQGRQRVDRGETCMKGTEVEKRKRKTLIDIEIKINSVH
jgi:hypothetical protein